MEDLIYWIIFGAGIGFLYGWRRTARSTHSSLSIVNETPNDERNLKARTVGYIWGLRLTACGVSAIIGALIGAAIWAIAAGGVYLLKDGT